MKALLLYRDRDFEPLHELSWSEEALIQDLELNTLFDAMALGDKFVRGVVDKAVLSGLRNDLETIIYRQDILKDCLKKPSVVREIYDLAVETITEERKIYGGVVRYPSSTLRRSMEALQLLVGMLKKLRQIADKHGSTFESAGFTRLFAMLQKELSDEYFDTVQDHLKELRFGGGVLVSAELGKGNKGTNYVLRKQDKKHGWIEWVLGAGQRPYSLYISDRDQSGAKALSELRDRGLNLVANALAQSDDHILSFFNMLRTELAFYVGCLNLHEQLVQLGEPTSFPLPVAQPNRRHSAIGLYDICLALTMQQKIVGNDLNADNKELVIITGANQGGKSTFLRSVGVSQLMMQCGMFVPAEALCSNICDSLFTHFKREEDTTMSSGKLDEELSRMSDIIDSMTANSMVLFNESFAATNEREGSEIAAQIIRALVDRRVKVFFVTHLYEFAHGFYKKGLEHAIFLRAERHDDGRRTFKLNEGEPLQTSFGGDLYSKIFGANDYN